MAQRLANNSQFDTFRIVRLIGKGGMGEVYEAYEDLLHRKVALKIISIDMDESPKLVNLFIKEGRAQAKLNHPNVATIYRLGFAQDMHYIAMEYVDGVSLRTLLYKKAVNQDFALKIFEKILQGTKALHDKDIIHRDLKPRNILITSDNNVKIVDFGISKSNVEGEKENPEKKIIGSTYYIPPEVLRGEAPTTQSDIWNLGVILYEMLTGEKPHTGNTEDEIKKNTKEQNISFSIKNRYMLPSELKTMIEKMCQRDPKDRYKTVNKIINDFNVFLEPRAQSKVNRVTSEHSILTKKQSNKTIYVALGIVFLVFSLWMNQVKSNKKEKLPVESAASEEVLPTIPPPEVQPVQVTTAVAEPVLPPPSQIVAPAPVAIQKTKKSSKKVTRVPLPKPKVAVKKQPRATKVVKQPEKPKKQIEQPKQVEQTRAIASVPVEKVIAPPPQIVLSPPKLLSPVDKISIPNQGTIVTPIVFNWSEVEGAKKYQIEFSLSSSFKNVIYKTEVSENQHIFDQSLSRGVVYWRVRAVNKESTWSETRSFVIE